KKNDSYLVELLDVEASAGPGIITKGEFMETVRSIEYTSDEALRLFGHRPCENIKMITVAGDSMQGTINPGDQVFIDVHINYFDGDGVYVFVYGQTLHIKRLQMIKDQLTVISDNNNYRDWQITKEDEDKFFIAGKVLISQSRVYKRYA
ncbi:helix-turn-helix transcriptional regulator, partial [Morganella morganii]|nr:helix-turn-helix transcriptional regulator [Morganella morganii]